jgi:hypothetical protein
MAMLLRFKIVEHRED